MRFFRVAMATGGPIGFRLKSSSFGPSLDHPAKFQPNRIIRLGWRAVRNRQTHTHTHTHTDGICQIKADPRPAGRITQQTNRQTRRTKLMVPWTASLRCARGSNKQARWRLGSPRHCALVQRNQVGSVANRTVVGFLLYTTVPVSVLYVE